MYGYGNSMFLATHGILARTNAAVLPVNTVAPVISGSTSLGSVLSSTTGTWTGTPIITFAYQWYRGATLITGATSSTYTIVVADSAAALTCQVTATNSAGSVSATSNAITAQTFTAPVNTVAPAITGTAQEGQTLTCSTGTWTGNPTPTYTYQWKRNNSNIGSATNSTYTLVTADVGQSIKCTVTATNAISAVNADSNTVTPTSAVDPDAQAFITAASITNPTQQSAINTLVVSLKGYNIWTKFKAIYPIVGGVASSHSVNLKTPGTYNLTFATGWTHSSNGMTPNGATFANTNISPLTNLSQNSTHLSYYSRTNTTGTEVEIGVQSNNGLNYTIIEIRTTNSTSYLINSGITGTHTVTDTDSRAFYIGTRTASNVINGFRNSTKILNSSTVSTNNPERNIYLGAMHNSIGVAQYNSTKQCAFASIGDGLTDTDAANFYTAVQAYQTTLGRSIGTQTVSDADAQAFVNAANITDQVEANAINNLVIGMKADGLWTKMKAIYPIVGGVASSHAVNLKTPSTYNLTFATGMTHSSTGMTPNGAGAYANTALNASTVLTQYSTHLSYYSRTSTQDSDELIMGVGKDDGTLGQTLYARRTNDLAAFDSGSTTAANRITYSNTDGTGLYLGSVTAQTSRKAYKNGVLKGSNTNSLVQSLPNANVFICCYNAYDVLGANYFTNKQCAFASIGDGLTDTEATNLYNRVNTFQTTLNRNV